MTDFDSLISRLEASTGPDKGIDGRLAIWRGWGFHYDFGDDPTSHEGFDDWPNIGGHWCRPEHVRSDRPHECQCFNDSTFATPPEWTNSVDACLALMREVLPGWLITDLRNGDLDGPPDDPRFTPLGQWELIIASDENSVRWKTAEHTSLPHAILIALLRAKQAEMGT